LWCATERARRRDTISKVRKRRLYNELCLRSRVEHIGGDEKFERTETARAGEVADRSAFCTFTHQCRECRRRIASGECGARNLQRFGECSVSLPEWLRLWKS
jgi:hypothetical protein